MAQQAAVSVSSPLAGIRVLDLTLALAGPFATMLLGDLGAEVFKIEPPKGEPARTTPPFYVGGESVYHLSINRNKKSIVIDLKHRKGLAVFDDLVGKADVVIYNFRPGVAERLGLAHQRLLAINPRIITCDITGFGRRGPEAARRAVDVVVQAMAGGMSITGEPGRPPVRAGIPTADLSAGMYATLGILAALVARERTGHGTRVETSLFHSQLSLLTYVAAFCLYSGEVPPPMGSGHMGTVPSQVFRTRDSYLAVEAGFNEHFQSLCGAVGKPELGRDPRFKDRQARRDHRDELIEILEAEFVRRTTEAWIQVLDAHNVACGPVNNVLQALTSAQSLEYGMVQELPFAGTRVRVLRTPLWFDGNSRHPMNSPPSLGAHTVEILETLLGYEEAVIRDLIAEGAVAAS